MKKLFLSLFLVILILTGCMAPAAQDPVSQLSGQQEAASQNEVSYTIRCVDQNGAPVEGAAVQICDAASCRVGMTDAGGLYTFHSAPCAWEVHVLTAPNGYTADHDEILHTALSGGELTFNLTKN